MLTKQMKDTVNKQRLGFVATVSEKESQTSRRKVWAAKVRAGDYAAMKGFTPAALRELV